MNNNRIPQTPASIDAREENVLLGTLGALLFALAGGVVWVLLARIGFVAGISGTIGVFCAVKGYALFAKKESTRGLVISIVAALLVLIAAWYFSLAWDVYDALAEYEGEYSFFECFKNAYAFLEVPEIRSEYIKTLILGLAFAAVAIVGYVLNYRKKLKAEGTGTQPPAPMIRVVKTADLQTQPTQDAPDASAPEEPAENTDGGEE